jgi:hypothetical protein
VPARGGSRRRRDRRRRTTSFDSDRRLELRALATSARRGRSAPATASGRGGLLRDRRRGAACLDGDRHPCKGALATPALGRRTALATGGRRPRFSGNRFQRATRLNHLGRHSLGLLARGQPRLPGSGLRPACDRGQNAASAPGRPLDAARSGGPRDARRSRPTRASPWSRLRHVLKHLASSPAV